MSPGTLLEYLRSHGAHLEVRNGRLLVEAPPGILTLELKAELAARKAELLALLVPASRRTTGMAGGPYAGFLFPTGDPAPDPMRAREALAGAERWREKRAEWLRRLLRSDLPEGR